MVKWTVPILKWQERISPRLNNLWRGLWPRGFVEPARYLYDHELVLVFEGTCRVRLDHKAEDFHPGSFIIVPPGRLHVSNAASRRVFRSCIHFDWATERIMPTHPVCCYHPRRPSHKQIVRTPEFVPQHCFTGRFAMNGAIPALVETLFHQWQTGDAFRQARCRGIFLELLMHLLWPKTRKTKTGERGIQLAYAAKDLLDQQGGSAESIQTLLASIGGSYSHICRLFHRHFDVTPIEYLNAKKLENAKALLRNPRLSIAEVAYAVGFSDAGYFARQFRRQNGVSPRQFRQ